MNQPTRNPWFSVLELKGTLSLDPLVALGAMHQGEGWEWNETHVRRVLEKKSPQEIARAMESRWKDPVFPRLDWMLDVLVFRASQKSIGAVSVYQDNLPYQQFATWLLWLGRQLELRVADPWKAPLADLLADAQGWLEQGPLRDLSGYRDRFFGKVCSTMAMSVLVGLVVEGLTNPRFWIDQPLFQVRRLYERMDQAYFASNFVSTWDGAEVLQGIVRAFPIPHDEVVQTLEFLEDLLKQGKLQ